MVKKITFKAFDKLFDETMATDINGTGELIIELIKHNEGLYPLLDGYSWFIFSMGFDGVSSVVDFSKVKKDFKKKLWKEHYEEIMKNIEDIKKKVENYPDYDWF